MAALTDIEPLQVEAFVEDGRQPLIAEVIVEELQGTQLVHFGNRHGFPIVSTATGVQSIVKRGERGFYPAISQAPRPRALLGDGLEHSLVLRPPAVGELELLQQSCRGNPLIACMLECWTPDFVARVEDENLEQWRAARMLRDQYLLCIEDCFLTLYFISTN